MDRKNLKRDKSEKGEPERGQFCKRKNEKGQF